MDAVQAYVETIDYLFSDPHRVAFFALGISLFNVAMLVYMLWVLQRFMNAMPNNVWDCIDMYAIEQRKIRVRRAQEKAAKPDPGPSAPRPEEPNPQPEEEEENPAEPAEPAEPAAS